MLFRSPGSLTRAIHIVKLSVKHYTSTAFPKYRTYGLGGEIDLVVPSMDDRIAVEVIDEFDDALFQFVF